MDVNSLENIATVAVILHVKSGLITEDEYIEARDSGTLGELMEKKLSKYENVNINEVRNINNMHDNIKKAIKFALNKQTEQWVLAMSMLIYREHLTQEEVEEALKNGDDGIIDLLKYKHAETTAEDEARLRARIKSRTTE